MAPESRIDELTARYAENPRRYFAPLANEYRKLGDPERAIALCRVHLPSQPGHMSGHIVLGQALYDAGELAAARTAFATAVALDDENLVALRHLGDIARREGDHAEARTWYARVLDADPQQPEVEALMATLAAEAAEREARAQDSAMVAADAEARPLPAPTGTPFPGGIGFSEAELDAFIAHVPVVADEAGPDADAGTRERDSTPTWTSATPVEPHAAVDGDDGAAHDAVQETVPVAATPATTHEDDAPVAAAPATAEVVEPAHAEEAEPLLPVDDPAWASATPIESPWTISEREGEPAVAAAPGGSEADGAVDGDRSLAPLAEGEALLAAPVPEAGDDALPIVDIASLAPDAEGTPAEGAHEVSGADEFPSFEDAEPGAVAEPWLAADEPAAFAWGAEAADEAASGDVAIVAGAAGADATAEVEAVEPVQERQVSGTDAPQWPESEAVGSDEVVSAVPETDVEVAAAVGAEPGSEAPVSAAPAGAAAVAESVPAAPPATTAVPEVAAGGGRAVTPVRAAALRLLSSLAPWREGATPAEGVIAAAAAGGDAGEDERRTGDAHGAAGDVIDGESAPAAEVAEEPLVGAPAEVGAGDSPASEVEPSAAGAAVAADATEAGDSRDASDGQVDMPDAEGLDQAADEAAASVPVAGADSGEGVPTVTRPTPAAGFTTATMAELYRRQGFIAEALAVYRELAEREPGDAWYREQVVALARELAQRTPAVPSQVVRPTPQSGNDLRENASSSPTAESGSLTPPGFASIAPALAESATLVPEPQPVGRSEGDWFGDVHEPTPDDWFGDVVPVDAAAVDELFGMEPAEAAEAPARPAVPTPISLDALGGGLDELFGMPVIAATDGAAAAWLEALGGELVGRPSGAPEWLPVPEAFDVPRGSAATAPGALLSFDRFFGSTGPAMRRPDEGNAPPLPPVTIGPSFGGTPLVAPRAAEPAPWERPAAGPPQPSAPPPPPAPPAAGEGARPPASEFHRWLEGLT